MAVVDLVPVNGLTRYFQVSDDLLDHRNGELFGVDDFVFGSFFADLQSYY